MLLLRERKAYILTLRDLIIMLAALRARGKTANQLQGLRCHWVVSEVSRGHSKWTTSRYRSPLKNLNATEGLNVRIRRRMDSKYIRPVFTFECVFRFIQKLRFYSRQISIYFLALSSVKSPTNNYFATLDNLIKIYDVLYYIILICFSTTQFFGLLRYAFPLI